MSVLLSLGTLIGCLLLFLLPSLLSGCGGGGAGAPAVPVAQAPADPLTVLQRAQRVLVLFAHPDDEVLIAPLLPDLCAPARHCRIVYLTQGKAGDCLRGLCEREPIETVRARELGLRILDEAGFEALLAGGPDAVPAPAGVDAPGEGDADGGAA